MAVCFHFIFFSTKCLEKKIKQAYYTICIQCAKEKNICAKCGEKTEIVEEWVFITLSSIYFFMNIPTITEYSMVRGIQVCSNEGLPCPFPRVDNYEILKIHWQTLRIFFSRTTGPISPQGILGWRGFKFFQKKNQSTIICNHWIMKSAFLVNEIHIKFDWKVNQNILILFYLAECILSYPSFYQTDQMVRNNYLVLNSDKTHIAWA